jgi:hypothetical protein
MPDTLFPAQKFSHPDITAKGETRATVAWTGLKNTVVQHRNALQYRVPELLHSLIPEE